MPDIPEDQTAAEVEPTTGPVELSPEAKALEGVIVDEATDEVLRLHLDTFEGPLEVLLYLIKVQEVDIFDIPIVQITEQFLRFIEMMRDENLDVTGDFLVMAATLIQIKSRMILPEDVAEDEEEFEEEDPRLELVEKLIEYRRYRDLTARFKLLEEERAAWFGRRVVPDVGPADDEEDMLEVSLYDLMSAFKNVVRFFREEAVHEVEGEGHSIDEKIEQLEERLAREGSVSWTQLLESCRSKVELVCYFLAILELCRMGRLRAQQHKNFDDIRLFYVDESARGEVVSI